jgi:hypothetical protein
MNASTLAPLLSGVVLHAERIGELTLTLPFLPAMGLEGVDRGCTALAELPGD